MASNQRLLNDQSDATVTWSPNLEIGCLEGLEPANLDLLNLSEWNANPVLITVETTDYPIENIVFPTVTVCPDDGGINTFEFVAKMFDYVKFPCFDDK